MTKRASRVLGWVAVLVVGMAAGSAVQASPKSASEPFEFKDDGKGILTVQAFADREAIAPGEPFNVLISITMHNGWHVYWANPNATGLPTKVSFKLPDGFLVGRTQYPVPHTSYSKELDETSYLLDEKSALITSIKPPADLKPGAAIEIMAKVSWLSCKENCIPGRADLKLTMPIVAAGGEVKAANGDVFKSAMKSMPSPIKDAEHVKLATKLATAVAKPGGKLTATLEVDIASKMHMQSNKPLEDYLIPAVVFVEKIDGFDIGEVEYPKAHIREDPMLGKMSEYAGKVAFKIPLEVDEEAGKAPRVLRGVFQYQICSDAGNCFRPQRIGFEIPIQMEGGEKPTGEEWAAAVPVAKDDNADNGGAAAAGDSSSGTGASSSAAGSTKNTEGWFNQVQNRLLGLGFAGTLLLAFMGGLILNVMPCVLPVISLKVLSFVRQAKEDRLRIFVLGLSYCAGILAFFGLLAWLFYFTGSGWGEHFQNPVVILILAGLVTAFAMSLFGVFTVFTPQIINELGQKAEEREGMPSAFFTGVLATVLGTACTAPFLSAAVAAASKYPASQGAWIFIAVGVGMASPIIVLSAFPAWLKFVPRPGKWMETFEAVMGFLLLGTVIWLIYPLGAQIGSWGLMLGLMWLTAVALAVWVKGRVQYGDTMGRKVALNGVALAIVLMGWAGPFELWSNIGALKTQEAEKQRLYRIGKNADLQGGVGTISWGPEKWKSPDEIPWLYYTDKALARKYVEAGYAVFVDFTADWCASCKTNLRTSINIEETRKQLRELNIVPFMADFTNEDEKLKEIMASYNRASVPVYLVFSPGKPDEPEILPEILSPGIVLEALKNAGPSRPGNALAAGR